MDIPSIIISIFVVLFAVTIHEASHGWAAFKLGDPTAHDQGRITLNPIAHIDPIGTILLPAMLIIMRAPVFGYAKPVPVNPYNLRNPKRDNMLISAAGPLSNLTAAAVFILGIRFLRLLSPNITAVISGGLRMTGGFQPIEGLTLILFHGALINTFLAVFNMIPIPPLDGSGVLMGFLSDEAAQKYDQIRPFGFLIILGLLYIGFLDLIFRPIYILIATLIIA
jgi:Zn-dependent protease